MREIKFRIWDDQPIKDGFKGLMINHEYAIKSSYFADALNGKYPLMQFTGLKDKKGMKIYEGDILNHQNSGNFHVRFYNYGFYLFYKGIMQSEHNTEHMEIIGNIHENPELL